MPHQQSGDKRFARSGVKDGDDVVPNNPDKVVSTGPLPSADTLIRSVEELLRKERENNKQNPDNNEDAE